MYKIPPKTPQNVKFGWVPGYLLFSTMEEPIIGLGFKGVMDGMPYNPMHVMDLFGQGHNLNVTDLWILQHLTSIAAVGATNAAAHKNTISVHPHET